ncbi:MAG: hypothetical protein RIQ46_2207 [Pseudomonadota bacterium]|jgi:uncharacterized protein YegJ (DUF2314 family)
MRGQAFLATLTLILPACSETGPVAGEGRQYPAAGLVDSNDPAMRAAMRQARAGLPDFLERLENPPAGATVFAVKFPLGGWEHVWVTGIRRQDEAVVGRIANDPLQAGHARGDAVRVPIAAISDWAWRDGKGRWHGYHTRQAGPVAD